MLKTPRREKSNLSSSSESDKHKDPVNVYCRLRMLRDEDDAFCTKLISPTVLALSCPQESKVFRKDTHYEFKHIFTSYASQKEVFDHIGKPLLNDLLQGKSGLLFTYGITGSGKTYTLSGDPYNPGIMPRCIDVLFNTIQDFQAPKFVIKSDRMNGFEIQTEADATEDRRMEIIQMHRQTKKKRSDDKVFYANDGTKILNICETNLYAVFISYIEIYNNTVFDLLDESSGKVLQSKILREDNYKNMYVNGCVELEVKSSKEAFELFNLGQKRKRMGHTLLNAESSRSHSVFNVRLVQLVQGTQNSNGDRVIPDCNVLKVSRLALVDLAGSERTNRTQNTGMRLKEASSINNSLMTLRSCMEILRDNQLNNANRLIPYRDSRLTLFFKNFFEGEGRVEMIVCISPSAKDYEENLQVLKFADIAKDVKVSVESRYTPFRKLARPTPKTPSLIKTPGITKIKSHAPIVLGPKIGRFKLDSESMAEEEDELKVNKLINLFKGRQEKLIAMDLELESKEAHFRKRLMNITNTEAIKDTEMKSLKVQLKKERQKVHSLEAKVLESEKIAENLETQNFELNEVIQELKVNLNEKDVKLNKNLVDRQKEKFKMAVKTEKMNQELDDKLRRQRHHLNAALKEKDKKLKKVRRVLEEELSDEEDERMPVPQTPVPDPAMIAVAKTPSSISVAGTNNKLPHHRRVASSTNRRRSKSAGEVWLEHNVIKPVPLGTVLQPSIKKRKSVTALNKAADVTNSKQSKYCLIAQEADTDGEVETKVYKADILPTCGGGAQVIFNDVERLRQESPVSSPKKF